MRRVSSCRTGTGAPVVADAVAPGTVGATVVSWPIGIGWPMAVDPGSTVVVEAVVGAAIDVDGVEGVDEALVPSSLPQAATRNSNATAGAAASAAERIDLTDGVLGGRREPSP